MLSYFGGKNKIAEWIYPFIDRKNIDTFAEVFAGAMWVYINIKTDYSGIDNIIYNDLNLHMSNLFSCMKEYDQLLSKIDEYFSEGGRFYTNLEGEEYKQFYKDLYYEYKHDTSDGNFLDNPPKNRPDFDAAVQYSFLITSAFNGCFPRSAGCSAFNKEKLKINALINKLKDERYQEKLRKITEIESLDFEEFIKKYDGENTFFYLDPPYFSEDDRRAGWYGVKDEFNYDTHIRLLNLLKTTKSKWALSYYYFEELEKYLPKEEYKWISKEYFRSSASFSDNKNEKGEELLIMNYEITEDEYKENMKQFGFKPKRKVNKTKKVDKVINKEIKKENIDDFWVS